MTGTVHKLIKGSLWLSVTRAIVNGLTTLSTFILARYLAPADFGLVAIGTTLMVLATSFTELSLTQALIRHKEPSDAHLSTAWTLNALRGLIVGVAFCLGAYPAAQLYADTRLFGILLALGLSVLLSGLINPRLVMLQRKLIFHQEFVLGVAQKSLGFVASVAIAVVFHSYWALIVGILVSQLANLAISYVIWPFRPKPTLRYMHELLSFSGWLSAGQIINALNWRVDLLLVGKSLGSAALGHYSVGSNLSIVATREAIAPLMQTVYPSFAAIKHDIVRLRSAYQRVQTLITAVALPFGIGTALVADRIVPLALGAKWESVTVVVQALASVFALQTLGSLVQPLGMAKGETRLLFIRDLQMFIVRVPLIFVAMLIYGLPGVLFGRIVTGLLSACINMMLVQRLIGISVFAQIKANIRAIVSVLLMTIAVRFTSASLRADDAFLSSVLQLCALILLGALVYMISNFCLWFLKGKPVGPEAEIIGIIAKLRSRFAVTH